MQPLISLQAPLTLKRGYYNHAMLPKNTIQYTFLSIINSSSKISPQVRVDERSHVPLNNTELHHLLPLNNLPLSPCINTLSPACHDAFEVAQAQVCCMLQILVFRKWKP
jgi:hypothetical protein